MVTSKSLKYLSKSLRRSGVINFVKNTQSISHKLFSSSCVRTQMNSWQTDGFKGIEGLYMSTSDVPFLSSPSEVLVKVSAASVNPLDVAVLSGYGKDIFQTLRKLNEVSCGKLDGDAPTFPLTVGRDFTGEVVSVGQNVKNVLPNDKVWGIVGPQRQGSHAEYVVVDSFGIQKKPTNLSDIEAASIPYVALTSWSAAVFSGGMKPNNCFGSKVLVLGASGGVGTFITQLLSSWGADVTGVCSESAFELVMTCGAQEVYDYNDSQTKAELTSYPRFDLIIDASGRSDLQWTDGLFEWKNSSYVSLDPPLLRNIDDQGLVKGFIKSVDQVFQQNFMTLSKGKIVKWAFVMPNPCAFSEITKMVSKSKIKPQVDKVFSFNDAKEAYLHVQNGQSRGKTVIDFGSKLDGTASQ